MGLSDSSATEVRNLKIKRERNLEPGKAEKGGSDDEGE